MQVDLDPILLQTRVGWALVLAGMVSGMALGLGFHRDGFLGGYASLRRRLIRLGHIALIALGALNVLWAVTGAMISVPPSASWMFLFGSIAMPAACFLVAWRPQLRLTFAVPALLLAAAVGRMAFMGAA